MSMHILIVNWSLYSKYPSMALSDHISLKQPISALSVGNTTIGSYITDVF